MDQHLFRDAEHQPGGTGGRTLAPADDGTTCTTVPTRRAEAAPPEPNGCRQWPAQLAQRLAANEFRCPTPELDELFATRAKYGGLSYADQLAVRQTVESMFGELKTQIRDIPPQDYVACRNFLESVTFAASKSELE